jgi:hypothetical protein
MRMERMMRKARMGMKRLIKKLRLKSLIRIV